MMKKLFEVREKNPPSLILGILLLVEFEITKTVGNR